MYVTVIAPSEQAKKGAVGCCAYPVMLFDGTPDGRVFAACVPASADEVDASTRRRWMRESCAQPDGRTGSENKDIRHGFHDFIKVMFPGLGLRGGFSLQKLVFKQAMTGTSKGAACDCYGPTGELALFIGEYKGDGAMEVRAGLIEAFAYARAVAIDIFIKGVPWEQIVVPVFSTDGCCIQFGAVFHGAPTNGVMCMVTSNVLDLTSEYGVTWATAYFRKLENHVREMTAKVTSAQVRQDWPEQAKDDDFRIHRSIHLKQNGTKVDIYGSRSKSLMHVMQIFAHLHSSVAATVVCFPLGMYNRLKSEPYSIEERTFLAFPNLEDAGYSVYPPVEENEVQLFLSQLRSAVRLLHEAGVVHGDLYVTNIMWNGSNVKIIDWDTAFFKEDGVPDDLQSEWHTNPKWKQYKTSEKIEDLDNFLVDTFDYAWKHNQWFSNTQTHSDMKQMFCDLQRKLAVEKGLIDEQ